LSALLVTTAAATPAVAATDPVPPGRKSCSVDGFEGAGAVTAERVHDRIVAKVSEYRILGGEEGRDKANVKIEVISIIGVRQDYVGDKQSGDVLIQNGLVNPLDFEYSTHARADEAPVVGREYTHWVSLTFIFDKSGPDPTCTTTPIKVGAHMDVPHPGPDPDSWGWRE
jgi:hypothetical protein